jgi:hypothetical protein
LKNVDFEFSCINNRAYDLCSWMRWGSQNLYNFTGLDSLIFRTYMEMYPDQDGIDHIITLYLQAYHRKHYKGSKSFEDLLA